MQLHLSYAKACLENQVYSLTTWPKEWDREINIDKCRIVSISNKKICIRNNCKMSGITWKSSNQEKYLRVASTKNLSWLPRINIITNRVNRTRQFLQRNLRDCEDVKLRCYKSSVSMLLLFGTSKIQLSLIKLKVFKVKWLDLSFKIMKKKTAQLKWLSTYSLTG